MEFVKSGSEVGGIGDETTLHAFSPEELHESIITPPRKCKFSASSNPEIPNPRPTKKIKKESSKSSSDPPSPSSPTSVAMEVVKADGDCEILVANKPPFLERGSKEEETDDDAEVFPQPPDSETKPRARMVNSPVWTRDFMFSDGEDIDIEHLPPDIASDSDFSFGSDFCINPSP